MTESTNRTLPSNEWVLLSERQPPKDGPRLLVTGNINERDAFGYMSHLWLVNMVHRQTNGSYAAFDDHDMKVHGLTHWRFAVPEATSHETRAELEPTREHLQKMVHRAADHWLSLQLTHPIPWEGGLDAAMEAACNEIRRLKANEQ